MGVTADKEGALTMFGFFFMISCIVLLFQIDPNPNYTLVTIGWIGFSLFLVAFLGVYFWEKIQEKICGARTPSVELDGGGSVGLREKRFQIEVL